MVESINNYESQFLERHGEEKTELSGVTIVLIISGGVLLVIMFFIFAKRTLRTLRTLRSRRGPHAPIGHDADRKIKREIERRLECVEKIAYEPKLFTDILIFRPDNLPPFFFRLKAVDDIKELEKEISKQNGTNRPARESLRAYLITSLSGQIINDQKLIHQFCDMYEHARHDPAEFGKDEYDNYHRMLMKLIDAAKTLKLFSGSGKSSPNRTPIKKQNKNSNLLDPSRLRPPGGNDQSNARINLSLGVQQLHQDDIYNRIDILDDNEILNLSNRIDSSKL